MSTQDVHPGFRRDKGCRPLRPLPLHSVWNLLLTLIGALSDVLCRPPEEVEQGYVVAVQKTEYEAGFEIHYLCKKNFLLDGPQKVTCLPNGSWSAPPPFCRGKGPVVAPPPRVCRALGALSRHALVILSYTDGRCRSPLPHPRRAEPRGHHRAEALALRRYRRHGPPRGKRDVLLQTCPEAVQLQRHPDLLRREAPASGLLPRLTCLFFFKNNKKQKSKTRHKGGDWNTQLRSLCFARTHVAAV